jgi:ABC-type transport system substrate-binding protein
VVTGLAVAGLIAAAVPMATPVAAQDGLPEVSREETFVFTPWGFATELPNPENWNPYNQGPAFNNQREMGLKGIMEALFYTNLNTGELIPWQGESYEYNEDFTEVTLKLRDSVKWCDGTPMTSADVEYTLESLRDADASVQYASIFKEWLEDVEVVDDLTSVIHLTKPGPRWFKDNLALGHENHIVMLPKHIWEGQDFKEYTFFDIAAGLPCGTGPYKIVSTNAQQYVADIRDEWWGRGCRRGSHAEPEAPDPHPGGGRRGDVEPVHHERGRHGQPAPAGHVRRVQGAEPEHPLLVGRGPGLGRPGRLRLQLHLQQHEGAVERRERAPGDQLRDQPPADLRHRL